MTPLEPDETTLRDGFRIKPIGNRYAILDENGVAVGGTVKSESLAVKRLLDHRIAYTQQRKFNTEHDQGAAHA